MIHLFVSSVLSFMMGLGLDLMTRKYLSLVPLSLIGGVLGIIIGISYVKMSPLPTSIGNLWDLLAVRPLLPHILVLNLTGAVIGGAIGAYMGKKGTKQEAFQNLQRSVLRGAIVTYFSIFIPFRCV